MQELKSLSLGELIDMLAEQTSTYLKILNKGATRDQLENCRELMTEIQLEIEMRRHGDKGSDFPDDSNRINGGKNIH
jgi:hypothetical protein